MAIYSVFSHSKWVDLSHQLCNSLPEGKTTLNPIKPPFSYGFPMFFLWFHSKSPRAERACMENSSTLEGHERPDEDEAREARLALLRPPESWSGTWGHMIVCVIYIYIYIHTYYIYIYIYIRAGRLVRRRLESKFSQVSQGTLVSLKHSAGAIRTVPVEQACRYFFIAVSTVVSPAWR